MTGRASKMKQGMKSSIPVSELCYYIFFCILFLAKMTGFYDGQGVFKACLVLAAFFAFVKIVLTSYDLREFIAMAALAMLGLLVYRNSGEKSALVFLVTMMGFKNIPVHRMMKIGLAVGALGFGAMVLKSMLGIGSEIVLAHHKFGMDILRKGSGYSHPNVLHVSYAVLVVLILFGIENNRDRMKAYVWTMLGNFVVFLYSVSYTGFMLVTLFIAFNLYFTYRKKFCRAEKVLIQCLFPACVLFSLFAPLIVEPDTPLFDFLNKVLNRRFYASRLYLQENPLTLLGNRIYASHTYALDSSYVTLLLYGGIILFVLVCAGYLYAIYASMKKQDARGLSILLSFAIAGVIEPFLFNLSFKNLSLLIIAGYLFSLCRNGRKVLLCGFLDREIGISLPEVFGRGGRNAGLKGEIKAVFLSLALGMAAGGAFYFLGGLPETAYVGEKYCDIEGEKTFIPYSEAVKDVDAVFYGYTAGEGGMYKFGGETIAFDRLRDTVRVIFVVTLAGYLVWGYWGSLKRDRGKE